MFNLSSRRSGKLNYLRSEMRWYIQAIYYFLHYFLSQHFPILAYKDISWIFSLSILSLSIIMVLGMIITATSRWDSYHDHCHLHSDLNLTTIPHCAAPWLIILKARRMRWRRRWGRRGLQGPAWRWRGAGRRCQGPPPSSSPQTQADTHLRT